jgi:hypothetical protein
MLYCINIIKYLFVLHQRYYSVQISLSQIRNFCHRPLTTSESFVHWLHFLSAEQYTVTVLCIGKIDVRGALYTSFKVQKQFVKPRPGHAELFVY